MKTDSLTRRLSVLEGSNQEDDELAFCLAKKYSRLIILF
jgi:hypothetical protein